MTQKFGKMEGKVKSRMDSAEVVRAQGPRDKNVQEKPASWGPQMAGFSNPKKVQEDKRSTPLRVARQPPSPALGTWVYSLEKWNPRSRRLQV